MTAPKSRRKEAVGGEVFVAFNFRVLDLDGDGTASLAEVESYLASQGETALRLSIVPAESAGDPLFRAIDADGDRMVTQLEASQTDRIRERDRDGNQVITVEELRGRIIGPSPPEFVAATSAGRDPQGPLRVQEFDTQLLPEGIDVRIEFRNELNSMAATADWPPLWK